MENIVEARPKPRKRRHVLRVVLIVLALAAIAEPVIMYRRLVRQREERRAAAEHGLSVPSEIEEGR
jgi:hypothetical protein